jgi:tripartite-type tricarboxylate transporter receptor subunit TctC
MVNGLLGGEIQLGWSGIPNVKELIAAGRLRGYCISIPQRSPSVPDIATCDELGYKSFDIATMMGLQGPPGIAPRVVARLQAETAAAMRDPAMTARMSQLGMVMQERGTAHYAQFMKDDMERYAAAVKKLHLQIRQ